MTDSGTSLWVSDSKSMEYNFLPALQLRGKASTLTGGHVRHGGKLASGESRSSSKADHNCKGMSICACVKTDGDWLGSKEYNTGIAQHLDHLQGSAVPHFTSPRPFWPPDWRHARGANVKIIHVLRDLSITFSTSEAPLTLSTNRHQQLLSLTRPC